MNKRAVNKDVYENYIDASVALFMEYYSVVSLSDNVQAELDAANCDEIQFPAQLDDRCRQLIKNRTAHYRRKQYLKACWKGLKYAAACVMVALSLTSVLFMTVEAVRVPIINYYIEQYAGTLVDRKAASKQLKICKSGHDHIVVSCGSKAGNC